MIKTPPQKTAVIMLTFPCTLEPHIMYKLCLTSTHNLYGLNKSFFFFILICQFLVHCNGV